MNFVAEDWMEKDNQSSSVSADNSPPVLPSDCPKVSFRNFIFTPNTLLRAI